MVVGTLVGLMLGGTVGFKLIVGASDPEGTAEGVGIGIR